MRFERYTQPWEYYTISNIFNDDMIKTLNTIPLSEYYSEYTHQDELECNYDQKNVMYHDVMNSEIAAAFTASNTVKLIQDSFDVDLRLKGVRLTLAEIVDERCEWVHVDSEDKIISAVVYLGTETLSGRGTWIYKTFNELYAKLDHIPNTGILFKPTDSTWHSLPRWDNNTCSRKALIVNYVDIPTPLQLITDRSLKIPENVFRISM